MTEDDIICINSYEPLADVIWEIGDPLPEAKIVHVRPTHLKWFFELCKSSTNTYVVLSTGCDYGLREQAENPVNADMENWILMVLSNRRVAPLPQEYEAIHFEERCVAEDCNIKDRFSMKCAMFTINTFNEIPPNIKRLYITNTDIVGERVRKLPYGIHPDKKKRIWEIRQEIANRPKFYRCYVNFTSYTMERYSLLSFYQHKQDNFFCCQVDKLWDDYAKEIGASEFVLCPEGNGLDSYRIWETHYLGSLPVMKATKGSKLYEIPRVEVTSYDQVSIDAMPDLTKWDRQVSDYAKLSYWKDVINNDR